MNSLKNLAKTTIDLKSVFCKRSVHGTSAVLRFLDHSPNAQLDKSIADRYMCLPIPEPKTQVDYVWIDGTGLDLRSKSRTLDYVPSTYKDCPNWFFDGSSTFFGSVTKSDTYIVPIAMYSDPFRRGNNKIVLCETFTQEKRATHTNKRQSCIEVLNKVCDQEVMFGFEQEYYLTGPDGRPYGWPFGGQPVPEGKNFSAVGADKVIARDISECVYRCCLYSGIDIYGTNAEAGYSQWEIQTGPTLSIKAADDLWILRFIICRVAEDFGVSVSFSPKLKPTIPGSGLHTNMSTKRTREDGGLKCIQEYVKKLEKTHAETLKHYDSAQGAEVKKRLTGAHETCHMDKFTFAVGDRSACIRISSQVADKKKGFFEDRRPCSDADPYSVITVLVKSCLL